MVSDITFHMSRALLFASLQARRRKSKGPCFQRIVSGLMFAFIICSFFVRLNKNSFILTGTKENSAVPPRLRSAKCHFVPHLFIAVTGFPVIDYSTDIRVHR